MHVLKLLTCSLNLEHYECCIITRGVRVSAVKNEGAGQEMRNPGTHSCTYGFPVLNIEMVCPLVQQNYAPTWRNMILTRA